MAWSRNRSQQLSASCLREPFSGPNFKNTRGRPLVAAPANLGPSLVNLSNKCENLSAHIRQLVGRGYALTRSLPNTPIETLYLVGEHDTWGHRTRNLHFERIILDLRCHRTADHQVCFRVVRTRTQHQCRSVSRLLMASLRRKV